MKRILEKSLWGLMTLFGAFGVTACADSSEEVIDNPNYNAETGEVNTQFVFTVSTGNETATRQSSGAVQADPSEDAFRGIEGVYIMSYILDKDGQHVGSATTANKLYDLATILSQGEIDSVNQNRVVELSLPLKTNTLMFYGKAIKTGSDRDQGAIDYKVGGSPENTSFKLRPRLTDTDLLDQTEKLLEKVLSRVVDCGLHLETIGEERDFRYAFSWNPTTNTGTELVGADRTAALGELTDSDGSVSYAQGGNTIYAGTLNWKNLGERLANGTLMTPLEEILGATFNAFTKINDGEVRAGSSQSVLRAISDVMVTNNKVAEAVPTGPEEFMAKLLAIRLNTRFGTYFEDDEVNGGVKFKPVSSIKESLLQYIGVDSKRFSLVTENDDLNEFPTTLDLPMGAAQLIFDKETGEFEYRKGTAIFDPLISSSTGNSLQQTDFERLTWPAELCYFGNSPVRVTSSAKDREAYPYTVDKWLDDAQSEWSDFKKDSHVEANTRAVAMQSAINYGTALLETRMSIVDDVLRDNNSGLHPTEQDNTFTASDGMFKLMGILIGGQNNEMGWDYVRKYANSDPSTDGATHSSSFNYVIYDNAVGKDADGNYNGISVPAKHAKSSPNYTLVFDNYNSLLGPNEQSPVYVALELLNNTGRDFYGANGLVRSNGTFYIVGKLDPATATNATKITFTDGSDNTHPMPPYDESGKTIPAKRVFIQDYKTTAEFQINANSLKSAFVTVPDLKATNISLGMAVDLKWTPGLDFVVNLGKD